MNGPLERLQEWYAANCDGEWEHSYGIKIETLDNPGWRIEVDLAGTTDEVRDFLEIRREGDDGSWVVCWKEDARLQAACGPKDLTEVLGLLADWLAPGAAPPPEKAPPSKQ